MKILSALMGLIRPTVADAGRAPLAAALDFKAIDHTLHSEFDARLLKRFKGGGETTICPMLESLVALGYASQSEDGKRFSVSA